MTLLCGFGQEPADSAVASARRSRTNRWTCGRVHASSPRYPKRRCCTNAIATGLPSTVAGLNCHSRMASSTVSSKIPVRIDIMIHASCTRPSAPRMAATSMEPTVPCSRARSGKVRRCTPSACARSSGRAGADSSDAGNSRLRMALRPYTPTCLRAAVVCSGSNFACSSFTSCAAMPDSLSLAARIQP